MFSTLLVPLDGSPLADRALPYAAGLARRARGKMILVHAVWNAVFPRESSFRIRDKATAVRAQFPDVAVEAIVWGMHRQEELGHALGQACRELGADLIVLSTHGRSGLGRWLYGSVADQVLRQTHMPVLLVPATCEYRWPADRPLRALVALDGSPHAEAALTLVGELPDAAGADLVLLRVVEPDAPGRASPAGTHPPPPAAVEEAGQYLEEIEARLQTEGRTIRRQVAWGAPAEVIADVARDTPVDLIVMATHGRSGLARLTLGSVATGTLQRACVPLLLIRPAAVDQTDTSSRPRPDETTTPPAPSTSGRTAATLMTQPVITVPEHASPEEIERAMQVHGVSSVLVVDSDGSPRGIVTRRDRPQPEAEPTSLS